MLADGESAILPGLLLFLGLYSATIWMLLSYWNGNRSRVLISCAAIVAVSGGLASLAILKDFFVDGFQWPPDSGYVSSLLFFGTPFLSGVAVLVRAKRSQNTNQKL